MIRRPIQLPPAAGRLLLIAALVATMLRLTGTTTASACSCVAPPSAGAALSEAAAVFVGNVSDVSGEANGAKPRTVTFVAEETWKGVEPGRVTVETSGSEAACGFDFEPGRRYLVYAGSDNGQLTVSLCSRTALASRAVADYADLGPGTTLRDLGLDGPGTNQPHPFPTRSVIFAGILAGVVLALGGAFLLWRRDSGPDASGP